MWVSASAATEDLFDTTIQPILDSYRPPGISALGFKKVSLGTIPPKVFDMLMSSSSLPWYVGAVLAVFSRRSWCVSTLPLPRRRGRIPT